MAAYNTRIVRRSNALQDWAYGREFRYSEVMSVGGGVVAPVKAAALAGGLGGLTAGLAFRADARDPRPRAARPRRGAERGGAPRRASSR